MRSSLPFSAASGVFTWALCLGGAACNSTTPTLAHGGPPAAHQEREPSPGAAAPPLSPVPFGAGANALQVAPAKASESVPLRLATWNLEWLDSEPGAGTRPRQLADYARLAEYARRLDADLVAVQEVDGEEALARVFPEATHSLYVTRGTDRQRVGFAWKKELHVVPLDDYQALGRDGLRAAADVAVSVGGHSLRLLSVHLKSGCSEATPKSHSKSCRKLFAQLPVLEAWIDERAREGVPFAVLGDFNRQFFRRPGEATWAELDDGDPSDADLWSPTEGHGSRCWDQARPHFIDHVLLGARLHAFALPESFAELVYDAADAPHRAALSDHCPLSIALALPRLAATRAPSRGESEPPAVSAETPNPGPAGTAPGSANPPIKGNISRGRKLYHLPSCPNYAEVTIDPAKGERTFSSEAEARAAGFHRAGNCP